MRSRMHYLWAIPYSIVVSLPFFVNDILNALIHLYNNVDYQTACLLEE